MGVGLGDAKLDWSFGKFGETTDLKTRAEMADEALEIIGWAVDREAVHLQGQALSYR